MYVSPHTSCTNIVLVISFGSRSHVTIVHYRNAMQSSVKQWVVVVYDTESRKTGIGIEK